MFCFGWGAVFVGVMFVVFVCVACFYLCLACLFFLCDGMLCVWRFVFCLMDCCFCLVFLFLFDGMCFCGVFVGELCWPVCFFVLLDFYFLNGGMFRLAVSSF